MTTNTGSKSNRDRREFYYVPGSWVSYITQAVTEGITGVLTIAITVVVTILVLLGGLWLAYVYLPENVFYIILAVLIADVALGIVLRAVLSRK